MFDTISRWYDAAWAWFDAVIGPFLWYGFCAVIAIGAPFGIWSALTLHRRGIPMQAKVIRHLRESTSSHERIPVYELMPDPKIALLSQYAGLEVKGAVSSGLTLRNIGSVVKVHYVPETKEVMSVKDQMLTPILLAIFWLGSLAVLYGRFVDENFWDYLF